MISLTNQIKKYGVENSNFQMSFFLKHYVIRDEGILWFRGSGPNLIRPLTPRNRKKGGGGGEKVMGFRTRDDACRRPGREVKKNENGFNEYRNAANRALLSGVPAHLIPRHIPHCPVRRPAV